MYGVSLNRPYGNAPLFRDGGKPVSKTIRVSEGVGQRGCRIRPAAYIESSCSFPCRITSLIRELEQRARDSKVIKITNNEGLKGLAWHVSK